MFKNRGIHFSLQIFQNYSLRHWGPMIGPPPSDPQGHWISHGLPAHLPLIPDAFPLTSPNSHPSLNPQTLFPPIAQRQPLVMFPSPVSTLPLLCWRPFFSNQVPKTLNCSLFILEMWLRITDSSHFTLYLTIFCLIKNWWGKKHFQKPFGSIY